MVMMDKIKSLAEMIENSKMTVVLTGAGMSTESGLRDFRSKNGWWNRINPLELATVDKMYSNYKLFHEFYSFRMKDLKKYRPHRGYEIISRWEKLGLIYSVVTQNVDGFHIEAGNKRAYELHGNLCDVRCMDCGNHETAASFIDGKSCVKCGDRLRPGVVLFGESLSGEAWNSALGDIKKAELVIVIGTSLQVYPAAELPRLTKGQKVYINRDVAECNGNFDLVIEGSAMEILIETDKILKKHSLT